jgi:hypothetical protein
MRAIAIDSPADVGIWKDSMSLLLEKEDLDLNCKNVFGDTVFERAKNCKFEAEARVDILNEYIRCRASKL